MQIMLRHIQVCVAHNALNGGKIHTQSLHLGNVSVPTAVGCQKPHTSNLFQCLPEFFPEVGGVAGLIFHPHFPDVLLLRIPDGHE